MKIESKNGYNIDAKCWIPENCQEIIIALHGFGGDKESSAISLLAEKLHEDRIGVITFDFPGHGKSEVNADKLTLNNCIVDLESIEEYIQKNYPNAKIGVFATSFGAYITLLRIAKSAHPYFSIVLRAPAICMNEIFENALIREQMENFKARGTTPLGFDREMDVPYEYYEELKANSLFELYQKNEPMLIVQGDQDDMAPIQDTKQFIKEKNTKAILFEIEGADHRMKKEGELEKAISKSREYIVNCRKSN